MGALGLPTHEGADEGEEEAGGDDVAALGLMGLTGSDGSGGEGLDQEEAAGDDEQEQEQEEPAGHRVHVQVHSGRKCSRQEPPHWI